jgi:hypothetical protein
VAAFSSMRAAARAWRLARRSNARAVLGFALAVATTGLVAAPPADGTVFSYTRTEQVFRVPPGALVARVVAVGGQGGGGALAAVVQADLPVSADRTLYVEVGGNGAGSGDCQLNSGGFNGGGFPGGGGASDIRSVPGVEAGSLSSRLIVAAGSGAGCTGDAGGNAGANAEGEAGGIAGSLTAGGGGGSGTGGCPAGGAGTFGDGGTGGTDLGGGGGGYFGGGGGGAINYADFCSLFAGGGGGGSSYVEPGAQNVSVGLDHTGIPSITISVPTSQVAPRIMGRAVDGDVLTELRGAWTGNPSTYAYQWLRCNRAATSCVRISGATGQVYALTTADVGSRISVQEVASASDGASAAASAAPTSVVLAPMPRVAIVGPRRPRVGTRLRYRAAINDHRGHAKSYKWTVDGRRVSSRPSLRYTFQRPGRHVIRLRVGDTVGDSFTGVLRVRASRGSRSGASWP